MNNCPHINILHTDVEPFCKDCDTFLVSGDCAYSNPGWLILAALYSSFEAGRVTEDELVEKMEALGYNRTPATPEQTKIPG
jgi:hypothetical protein